MRTQQQPIETQPRISWRSRLEAMKVNSSLTVAFRSAPTVRHAIWTIQNLTKKKFETTKKDQTVIVTRTA